MEVPQAKKVDKGNNFRTVNAEMRVNTEIVS